MGSYTSWKDFAAVHVAAGVLAASIKGHEEKQEQDSHCIAGLVGCSRISGHHGSLDDHHANAAGQTKGDDGDPSKAIEQHGIDPVHKCSPRGIDGIKEEREPPVQAEIVVQEDLVIVDDEHTSRLSGASAEPC